MPLFYRNISNLNTDQYFSNVSLLLRGSGTSRANAILDESPNEFITTPLGDAILSSAVKKYGTYSMKFDGNGDRIQISDDIKFNLSSGAFTIEAWFYCNSIDGNPQTIISKDTYGSNYSWGIIVTNNSISTYTSNIAGDYNFTSNITIAANTWHHVALVGDGTNMYHYFNGVLIGTKNRTLTDTPSNITVGCIGWNSPTYFFNGYIDDLRITKGVARYISNFTPPTQELPNSSLDDPNFSNVSLLLRGVGDIPVVGTILDESPNLFTTTIIGNTGLSSVIKKYGNYSIRFDGNGDYLTIPSSSAFNFGSGDFTIEAWIYMHSLPVGNGYPSSYWIVGGGPADSNPGFDIAIGSTNFQVGLTDFASLNINTSHGMSAKVWYHIAIVRSGNNLYCFKDGNLLTSANVTGVTVQSMNNGISIAAAEPVGSTGGNFNGYIDDLRITKGVARYTSNFTPPSDELPSS